jgi:hypothetical protein
MTTAVLVGLFILWQLAVLWGALHLSAVRSQPRLPRPARIPREFATGEWHEAPR